MNEILVQPRRDSFDRYLDYINKNDLGIEVVELSKPGVLNDTVSFYELKNFYKNSLKSFRNKITYHGAFIDLKVESPDRSIRLASRNRIRQSIEAAIDIGASSVVFHSGYNPIIQNPYYISNFIEQSSKFWKEMIEEYQVQICIENMWDKDPETLRALIDNINNELFGICLDIGHLNIYAAKKLEEFIKVLSNNITHLHFNDNMGLWDDHLAIGEGSVDWISVGEYLEVFTDKPNLVIEVDELEQFDKSYKYLKANRIFPFHKPKLINREAVFSIK